LGDIFCCSDTQYNTNQTAVSTVHMPVNDYLVPLLTCTLTAAIIYLDTMLICCCLLNTIIIYQLHFANMAAQYKYIQSRENITNTGYTQVIHHHRVLGFFMVIAMLYTSIGIGIGYWYR